MIWLVGSSVVYLLARCVYDLWIAKLSQGPTAFDWSIASIPLGIVAVEALIKYL